MLHAPPLPGSPRYAGSWEAVCNSVLRDADTLASAGFPALLLENFGDAPFFADSVPAATIAHLAALAEQVRRAVDLPLGINVLRNDGSAAIAIAAASGACFVRINILCGAALTDQGIITGRAAEVLRLRAQLGASRSIRILADAAVKHAAPLAARPLAEEIGDLTERGLADGIIISGSRTGAATDAQRVAEAKGAARDIPIYVGSGVDAANAPGLLRFANGLIVGTALKDEGDVSRPVCLDRAKAIVAAVRGN